MQTITLPQIQIDNSILLSLKNSSEELVYKMKLYTAIALYQKRQLSLGKSAQFMGMDRLSFIELLKRDDIPIFDYSNRDMNEVFENADSLEDY
jgi:predicted HTH domain antitoxin